MSFIKLIFHTLAVQPLYNALIFLYVIIPDFGVAIILLTVLIRLALLPLSRKSIESQKKMQDIQPELKKIQEKYKHDRQLQGQKIMEFYQQKKVNPASGCLPLVVQLFFLLALWRVFMMGLGTGETNELIYSFAKNPGHLNLLAFGFFDLSVRNIPLTVVAAGLQFIQAKMIMAKNKKNQGDKNKKPEKKNPNEPDFGEMMQQQMLYLGPVMTLIIGLQFPSGLILYWTVTTIFMIVQQYFVLKKAPEKQSHS